MRALVLVALAGCFDPSPKPGQVCADWCPAPETCVANVCRVIDDEEHRANYMFLTSDARPIVEQTASSLDDWCNERAMAAGLPGTYVAWFSTTVSAASKFSSLQNTTRGWIRPDGLPFADTVQDIITGKLYYPPRISDAGDDMARDEVIVATGTSGDGMARDTCGALAPGDPEAFVTVGRADGALQSWTHVGEEKCGVAAHIYCFAKDRSVPVAKLQVPPGRKHVFLTSNAYLLSTPADADIKCRNEAGGSPSYVALLATAAQSVKERFAKSIGPWYRIDGVVATADMTELTAPIEVTLDGTHMNAAVWFGASSLTKTAESELSCTNWTEKGGMARTGQSERSAGAAPFASPLATNQGNCGAEYRYYCAQL